MPFPASVPMNYLADTLGIEIQIFGSEMDSHGHKGNEDSINYTPSKKAYEAIFNDAKTNVPFIVEDDEAYYLIVRFDITKRMTDDDLWTEDQMKAVASRKYWDNFTDDKKEMANALNIDQQSDRALKKYDPFKLDFSTSSSSSASN